MQKSDIPKIAHHLLAIEYAGHYLATTPKVQKMNAEEQIAQLFEMYQRAYDRIEQLQFIPKDAE